MGTVVSSTESNEKQSWVTLAFVWTGAVIGITALILGGTLAAGLSFWQAIAVTIVADLIIVALMCLQGIQGAELNSPTVVVASHVFGKAGSKKIISIILGVACLGWFGIQANVTGEAFTTYMATHGIAVPVQVSSLFWGVVMLISAIYGIKMLKILNYIAVPILVIVCVYGAIVSVQGVGLDTILNFQGSGDLTFMGALSVSIGSFALGAIISADYSQYAKSRKDVIKASVVGILPVNMFMIVIGAILTISAGTANISEIFMGIGSPILGIIALILATWTTNAVNAFSGGLAIVNVFNVPNEKKKVAIAIAGAIGTLLAVVGILDHFVPIMSFLTATIPPVGGVMIASYWILFRGDKSRWYAVEGINYIGLTSWLVGALAAGIPVAFEFIGGLPTLPSHPLLGIAISFMTYLVAMKVFGKATQGEQLIGEKATA